MEKKAKAKEIQSEDSVSDHPLLFHLQENESTISAYTFSAPPDHWLTSVSRSAIYFSEEERERWQNLSRDDIVFFHSQTHPANSELPEQSAGLIGAAVVGHKYTKEDNWWWQEHGTDEDFPLVVGFSRVFYTGKIQDIDADLDTSIIEKDVSVVENEIESLTNTTSAVGDGCRFEVIHDRCLTGHKPDSRVISAWSKSKCLPRVFYG